MTAPKVIWSDDLLARFKEAAPRLRYCKLIAAEIGIPEMAVYGISNHLGVPLGTGAGRPNTPLIDLISSLIERDTGITRVQLQSHYRGRAVARARFVAMWLLRIVGRRSFPEVGRAFGGRDHTTAMHACSSVAIQTMHDSEYAAWVENLEQELRQAIQPKTFVPVEDAREAVAQPNL